MNYRIKYQISATEYLHASIFEPLPYTGNPPEVNLLEFGMSLEDGMFGENDYQLE